MTSFEPQRTARIELPIATAWLLGACMEAKGRQDLWLRQRPETLAALREQAIVGSAESSNRIEGVTVAPDRLRPLVLGGARPRDRPEQEILGYRRALDWIFTSKRPIPIEPRAIRHLHELCQGGSSGDGGRYKERDNEIIELLPGGERRVRFRPTPARATPKAVERLCLAYRDACDQGELPPPLAVASFVLDFLCIHPFRDGNGRVSRLLTTLLLGQQGFFVPRYVSLERIVEESKSEYYGTLERSSAGWHEAAHEIVPWWNYFLAILRQAYARLAERVEGASGGGKSELVRQAALRQVGPFTLGELKAHCPEASLQLLKKVLSELKRGGLVVLSGRGRGARWRVRDEGA